MHPAARFHDRAEHLWQMADVILVRCPRCGERARVDRVKTHWICSSKARLACTACGYARSQDEPREGWAGPVVAGALGRCPTCGNWRRRNPRRTQGPPPAEGAVPMSCPGCGTAFQGKVTWSPVAFDRPVDLYFGLPLWLQTPVRGETLWAYNDRHLGFLRDYVGASLRERIPNRNRTMASRLPQWIKSAQNRAGILHGLGRLEEMLR